MTTPEPELRPLDYEAVAASYKGFTRAATPDGARSETAAYNARRDMQEAARKALPGMLPDFLLLAAWLIAAGAVFAGFALWPDGYVAREAQILLRRLN
jgi:hypothetical protein